MRFTLALVLALFAVVGTARADNTALVCYKAAGTSNCVPVTTTTPLPVVPSGGGSPVQTSPPKLTAYGTVAVTASSVALSTLTPGPNSPAWTTAYPSSYVSIRNSIGSAGTVYFCPLGGTCSATVGEPIAQGETIFRNIASGTAATLFSTAGATVIAEE